MYNLFKRWKAFYHPPRFQGWGIRKNYFEGWYFKLVNADGSAKFAIIPGIAMDNAGAKQAFIQILDGRQKTAEYFKFPIESFSANSKRLEFTILDNFFSEERIDLNVPGLTANIRFSELTPWPSSIYAPGIMGPFAYAPYMECYHGIVSMDHKIEGVLHLKNQSISLKGGRGYTEKDWGRSFPSAYVWMQSNHFSQKGISFKASVARIPWLTGDFTGFIAGFWNKGELIRFTTYNRCSLEKCAIYDTKVELIMDHPKFKLFVIAERKEPTELASPILGAMAGKIAESMEAVIQLKLYDKRSGEIIFEDKGNHAGLEVAGAIERIIV